ncbi:MAG: hypothetical protein ABIX01_13480 [Chitinophagaceae bacterium]
MRKLSLFGLILTIACNSGHQQRVTDAAQDTVTKTEVNNAPAPARNCGAIVMKILETSDEFQKLTKGLEAAIIKNGGTSYGIGFEGSPNPETDSADTYSTTYDFNLHENYPDRMTVTARFSFDKTKRQLFKHAMAEDTLIPIVFNKSLLLEVDAACK